MVRTKNCFTDILTTFSWLLWSTFITKNGIYLLYIICAMNREWWSLPSSSKDLIQCSYFSSCQELFSFWFLLFLACKQLLHNFCFGPLLAHCGIFLQNVKKLSMLDKVKRTIFLQNPIAYSERPSGNNQSQCTIKALSILYKTNSSKLKRLLKKFFNADSIIFLYVLQIPWCLVWWDNIKFPVFFPSSYSKQEHHWSSCSRSQNKVSL